MPIEKPLSPFDLAPEPAPVYHAPQWRVDRPVEHPAVLPSAVTQVPVRWAGRPHWLLAIGHRCASVAIVALVAGMAATWFKHSLYWPLLLAAFISADIALMTGVVVSWRRQAVDGARRSAIGIIIVSLLVVATALALIVLAQTGRLSGLVDSLRGV